MITVGYCSSLGGISGPGGIFYFIDFVTDEVTDFVTLTLALTERILIDGLLQIWNLNKGTLEKGTLVSVLLLHDVLN